MCMRSEFPFEAEDEHVGTYAGKMNKRVEKRVSPLCQSYIYALEAVSDLLFVYF